MTQREGSNVLKQFDGVAVIYAGERYPSANRGTLFWPHRSTTTYKGARTPYVICAEGGRRMGDISVFCHEFGHILGLAHPEDGGFALNFARGLIVMLCWLALLATVPDRFHVAQPIDHTLIAGATVLIILNLIVWIGFWGMDVYGFTKVQPNTVDGYYSFDVAFLASQIGMLIMISVIQALTAPREKDWMDRQGSAD